MISSLSWWCLNIFFIRWRFARYSPSYLHISMKFSTKAKSSFPSLSPKMPCCANWSVSDWRQRLSRDLATSKTWGELWFTQNMWIWPGKMVGLTRKMALTREHIQTSLGNNAFQQWKKNVGYHLFLNISKRVFSSKELDFAGNKQWTHIRQKHGGLMKVGWAFRQAIVTKYISLHIRQNFWI